jgi:7-cyano-7-deazaguanine synthase
MKKTIVPNRNMMMLSIAGAVAVSTGSSFVVTGVHAGDHAVYPDCRPQFINLMSDALAQGNEGNGDMRGILAPYLHSSKKDIAVQAIRLGVDFSETWSCYKGGSTHCGRCGTCVERLEAIHGAEIDHFGEVVGYDSTVYADNEFWKEQVAP